MIMRWYALGWLVVASRRNDFGLPVLSASPVPAGSVRSVRAARGCRNESVSDNGP